LRAYVSAMFLRDTWAAKNDPSVIIDSTGAQAEKETLFFCQTFLSNKVTDDSRRDILFPRGDVGAQTSSTAA